MYNHVKVEKPQHDIATCNNKQWFGGNLHVLKRAWNGSMHCIFVIPKKLMFLVYIHFKTIVLFSNLSTCFPTPQNNFCSYRRKFQIIPYPHPSHPKELGVNVCKHKFACTNVTPKWRNGAQSNTRVPYCAWIIKRKKKWNCPSLFISCKPITNLS